MNDLFNPEEKSFLEKPTLIPSRSLFLWMHFNNVWHHEALRFLIPSTSEICLLVHFLVQRILDFLSSSQQLLLKVSKCLRGICAAVQTRITNTFLVSLYPITVHYNSKRTSLLRHKLDNSLFLPSDINILLVITIRANKAFHALFKDFPYGFRFSYRYNPCY